MSTTFPTVFVLDDEASIRRSLGRLLRSAGYTVETFESASDFFARINMGDLPGCAILDLYLPGTSGLQIQRQLIDSGRHLSIVFLSGGSDVRSTVSAMKGGAIDFLSKPVNDEELLAAVRRAVDADTAHRAVATRLNDIQRRISSLTHREREVFDMVVTGMLNKQIAAGLGIAEKTVKVHRAHVMQKMSVLSLAELARIAEAAGIDSLDVQLSSGAMIAS